MGIWIQFRKPNSEIWFCATVELCHHCSCSRVVEIGIVWFTTLCTLCDKLCSMCTQNKQMFFSETCARLGYYPASSGNSLPTVQDNPLVSYSNVKMGPMGCPKTSVRNYHSSLRNSPEARSSHLHRSRILKLCGSCFDSRCLVSALVHFTEYFFVFTLCTEMWKKACNVHSWEQGFFGSQSSWRVLSAVVHFTRSFVAAAWWTNVAVKYPQHRY